MRNMCYCLLLLFDDLAITLIATPCLDWCMGFDPDLCAAWKRIVGTIDNLAGPVNLYLMSIVVCLVCFTSNDWLTFSGF